MSDTISVRITKRAVDAISATGSEFFVWDADIPGFGVRVRPNGTKSYVFQYRAGHGRRAPSKKLTFGPVARFTPEEARTKAKKALGDVANGRDPAAEKADAIKAMTVSELSTAFIANHVVAKRKKATAAAYDRVLRLHVLPELGTAKADRLTRSMVERVHLRLKDRPAVANKTLAVIASMYSFAQARGYVPEGLNPASRIEKYPEDRRERFLSTAELGRLGDAIKEAENEGIPWDIDDSQPTSKHLARPENRRRTFDQFAVAALRLLLLTGCRLREILHLKWSEVDVPRGMLFLSDSKTGRKPVIMNAHALAVLISLPRQGDYVILGENPKQPRHDLKRIWAAVSSRAKLEGVRIHDLRHTFASFGASDGLGLPIVGKLLGHAQPATTARYAHLDNDPLRKASDQIANNIAAALNGHGPIRKPTQENQFEG